MLTYSLSCCRPSAASCIHHALAGTRCTHHGRERGERERGRGGEGERQRRGWERRQRCSSRSGAPAASREVQDGSRVAVELQLGRTAARQQRGCSSGTAARQQRGCSWTAELDSGCAQGGTCLALSQEEQPRQPPAGNTSSSSLRLTRRRRAVVSSLGRRYPSQSYACLWFSAHSTRADAAKLTGERIILRTVASTASAGSASHTPSEQTTKSAPPGGSLSDVTAGVGST
mmetsp:Transcript_20076/g.64133  ORF Transcript_20076/g.64133 Transcript_20076/m.64133 type:complete len:230 (+) Transcript_20076:251-940(+)